MRSILKFNDYIQKYVTRLNYSFKYKKYMKMNSYSNTKAYNEKLWINKWNKLGIKPNPIYYRYFSRYIGYDLNIMPEDIGHLVIEKFLNNDKYLEYYEDKNMFDKILPKEFTPKTLLRRICGSFYNENYELVNCSEDNITDIINTSFTDKIIIKPAVDTCSGVGVKLIKRINKHWEIMDSKEIFSYEWLQSNYKFTDLIIQESVIQSKDLDFFNNTSINTIRVSVYRSVIDNSPHVTAAILRIGNKGSYVDNAHAGGRFCGLELNGKLCHRVLNQYGEAFETFNNVDYRNDFIIPNFEKIKEFAKRVAIYIPHHRLLALDIALDKENKPILIEYNISGYSMWLYQLTISSALGEYTDEIINYCKNQIKRSNHV